MEIRTPNDHQLALMTEFIVVVTQEMFAFSTKHSGQESPADIAAALISSLSCLLADFVRTAPFSQDDKDSVMLAALQVAKMRFEHGQVYSAD